MNDVQPNLLTRDDTFFGVCQGLGEDLGFHPNILRIAFGVALLWNPAVVIGAYAAAGAVVLATRLLVPNPPVPQAAPAEAEPETAQAEPLPLAA